VADVEVRITALRDNLDSVATDIEVLHKENLSLDAETAVRFDHLAQERRRHGELQSKQRAAELTLIESSGGAARQAAVLASQLREIEEAAAVQRYV
jgi:hypothetical protein